MRGIRSSPSSSSRSLQNIPPWRTRPVASRDVSREHIHMSRDAARKVLDTMVRHSAGQDAAVAEIRALCTEEEFNDYRRMIGQSMASMYLDVIAPIVGMYPELTPPGLKR